MKIEIDLSVWEDAIAPINTSKVDKKMAEKELYDTLRYVYGYSDDEILTLYHSQPDTLKSELFHSLVNEVEEDAILNNGGFYYED